MAIRKLYGNIDSLATQRALASILEHELEFEFITIDLKAGEHKKEPFLSFNPFGQVPVYQDEDLILFESRAIMRFISHFYLKPGKEQVYMVPKMQMTVAGWIDAEDHQFNPPSTKLIQELLYKPWNRLPTDEAVVAQEEAKLAKVLDVYQERLKISEYLGGEKFTSADLTHLPNLNYLMATPVKRLFYERPCVGAWCDNILSRPAWARVVKMIEKAGLGKSGGDD